MKVKIFGPILLLTLATQFARAAKGEAISLENKNNAIQDTKLAAPAKVGKAIKTVTSSLSAKEEAVALINEQESVDMTSTDDTMGAAATAYDSDASVQANAVDVDVDEDQEYSQDYFVDEDGENNEQENSNDEEDDEEMDETEDGDMDETEDEEIGETEDENQDQDQKEDDDEDENHDEDLGPLEDDEYDYIDPLTAVYDQQTAKCSQSKVHPEQKQQQQQKQQQDLQKRDETRVNAIEDSTFSADATPEAGGACIDSFVDFALRFRERCTVRCLKAISHLFSDHNVFGALDCFGCTSFFVSGISALGNDCGGIFADISNPLNATAPTPTAPGAPTPIVPDAPTPTAPSAQTAPKADAAITPIEPGDDSRLGHITPVDSALPALDLANIIKSLGQLTSKDVQEWIDIGSDLATMTNGGSDSTNVLEGDTTNKEETDNARMAASKDLLNKVVSKAATIANWDVTPEILD
ncbi:hypothetical protein FBU30_006280 [Linnemannia zychae]|nr:hypothetical protein FBU30_006280 [Linnemannia zychae]